MLTRLDAKDANSGKLAAIASIHPVKDVKGRAGAASMPAGKSQDSQRDTGRLWKRNSVRWDRLTLSPLSDRLQGSLNNSSTPSTIPAPLPAAQCKLSCVPAPASTLLMRTS